MSVNLEQAPGTGGGVTEPPPHPCKPKDASSATAVPTPSFSSSRRVKLCMGPESSMPSTKQRWDRLPSPACLDYRKLAHRHAGPPWDSGSLRRPPARISGTYYRAPGLLETELISVFHLTLDYPMLYLLSVIYAGP